MRYLKRFVSVVVITLIFFFLIRTLILNWGKIPFHELHFNGWYIAFSFAILVIHILSYSKSWQEIMAALGHRISFTQSLWIIATTQIAKYVPGRVWYMIGRVYVGRQQKVDGKKLAVSMVIETCLLVITSGILSLIAALFIGTLKPVYILLCGGMIVLATLLIHPRILSKIVNILLKFLKRKPVDFSISYCRMIKISVYFFGLWIAQIVGFYCLVAAVYPVTLSFFPVLTAAYCLSWITGFIVLIAPSGLGVREGVMTLILSSVLTTPLAIAMSFISRIWFTLFEIVVFFIGLIVRRTSKTQQDVSNADRLD